MDVEPTWVVAVEVGEVVWTQGRDTSRGMSLMEVARV